MGWYMDEVYMQAEEQLEEEFREKLGREPTPPEMKLYVLAHIEARAEDLMSDRAARAYDHYKDKMKYGE